jgi:thioredoxin 1
MNSNNNQSNGVSKTILWIILAALVIGGGVWALSSKNNSQTKNTSQENMLEQQDKMTGGNMTQKEDAIMEDDTMTKPEEKIPASGGDDKTMNESAMMSKERVYKDYSAQAVAEEQSKGQKVVLFFWASWCPYCKAADSAFKANLDKIPEGVSLLKTNYDTEKELKTKYGVTYQHTFVQIDGQGNMITKWNSGDVDLLIKNIK